VLTGVTVARSVDPIDVFADTFGDGAIVASSIAEITLSSLRLGYETVSFHGYHRWFYQRELWYPTVGFQRIYFADEMQQFSPPKCGTSFAGTCDLWIADRVEQELLMPGKKRENSSTG